MSAQKSLSVNCVVAISDSINIAIAKIDKNQKFVRYLDILENPENSTVIVQIEGVLESEKNALKEARLVIQSANTDIEVLKNIKISTYMDIVQSSQDKVSEIQAFKNSLMSSESTKGLESTLVLLNKLNTKLVQLSQSHSEFIDAYNAHVLDK